MTRLYIIILCWFCLPSHILFATQQRNNHQANIKNEKHPVLSNQEYSPFLKVSPSKDSRLIFVSSSQGKDSNNGLTPNAPVQSLAHAINLLRNNHPDWLLLKTGDVWNRGLGQWRKSGRSITEPMVITSYGKNSTRPLLLTATKHAFITSGSRGAPKSIDYVLLSGLHFYAQSRDPNTPYYSSPEGQNGVTWLRGSKSFIIEDCVFKNYKNGISIQDFDHYGISNVTIRNNLILDSYSTISHSQGLFASGVDGLTLIGNIFDHNGWNNSILNAQKTIFNHGIYIQNNNRNVRIVDNIILRSSSHGIQLRCGGEINGNIFIRNPISLLLGGGTNPNPGGVKGTVQNNIILNGTDIDNKPRGWGIDLENINTVTVNHNIIAHILSSNPGAFAIRNGTKARISNNTICCWGEKNDNNILSNNTINKTIEAFNYQTGGKKTFDSFVNRIRKQSYRKWDETITAANIRYYFNNQ